MPYRLKDGGRCKVQYGAKEENISPDFMNIIQSTKAATLMDPTPTIITSIRVSPTDNSPIREILSGILTVKDGNGDVIETATGIASNTSNYLVFSLTTGFEPTDSVTLCFGDVVGKDVDDGEYANSFEYSNGTMV